MRGLMVDHFAVVITHNRPALLRETVQAIGPQVDMVIVIDNASHPPVVLEGRDELAVESLVILRDPTQPPNLARLWKDGLHAAMTAYEAAWIKGKPYVAFLCDDAPPPPGWFAAVTQAMEETGCVVGCSGGDVTRVKTCVDADISGRMPGWAWILDPVSTVRPDPSMAWWWLDTDIDFQARTAGGMVRIVGYPVPNQRPNEYTASMPWAAERIGKDTVAFEAKYGPRPW